MNLTKGANMLAETKEITKSIEGVTFAMIHAEAVQAAKKAVQELLTKWREQTGGNEYGEPMYCGFAWVDVKVRSNSKLGKAMQAQGFRKSWEGGYLQLWDPAQHRGQSMDCKEAGAQAYADVLRQYGITAYMGSRAD
jgi:hypothetical protein